MRWHLGKRGQRLGVAALLLVVAGAATLVYWDSLLCPLPRANREHLTGLDPQFSHLAERRAIHCPADETLSRREVQRDLDELEYVLETRYSYLRRKGVDYRAALDTIRLSATEGSDRGILATQLSQFIALFGDGHSGVNDPPHEWLNQGALPFIVADTRDGVVAVKADRTGFLDDAHPLLVGLDGRDLDFWRATANRLVPQGSRPFVRYRQLRELRRIGLVRALAQKVHRQPDGGTGLARRHESSDNGTPPRQATA